MKESRIEQLCSLMRYALEANFSLYNKSDTVKAGTFSKGDIWVAYSPAGLMPLDDVTRIDLNLRDEICYVPEAKIEPSERRKGYGRELFEAVEEFCKELGISRIELTCSGKGNNIFYKKLGFKQKGADSSEMYKEVNE